MADTEMAIWKTGWRLKLFRLLRSVAIVLLVVDAAYLLLAAGILKGALTRTPALFASGLIVTLGALAGLGFALAALARGQERTALAREVEGGQPLLLDRLTTIVDLEGRPGGRRTDAFLRRIRRQADEVVAEAPPRLPRMDGRSLALILGCALASLLTVDTYRRLHVWARVQPDPRAAARADASEPAPPAPPADTAVESATAWGEVRVVEPGHDMRATKVDVVPLQIEAASSAPLTKVDWFTAVNGGDETASALPVAAGARYAVFDPTLSLDQHKLSDYDVLSYGARASSEKGDRYASDLYFVEIRPFREEIQKLPGGEGGRPAQCLEKLSSLISRQEQLLRDTHRHEAQPESEAKGTERARLSRQEAELARAAEHLYAEMASEMEHQPIGEVLDHLAGAEDWAEKAARSLKDAAALDSAKKEERSALKELIATRKGFHKAVTEKPDSFSEKEPAGETVELTDRLGEMAEFRDEARAARSHVDQTLEKQRDLARRAPSAGKAEQPRLAEEERQLVESLSGFSERYPRTFRQVVREVSEAKGAMEKAAEALGSGSSEAAAASQDAAERLEELAGALGEKALGRELADAYKLKRIVDRKAADYQRLAGQPGALSGEALERSVEETRRAVSELKRAATEEPTSGIFGPELAEALGDGARASLERKLDALEGAPGPEARGTAAGSASQALRQVAEAFEKSQPPTLREARREAGSEGSPEDPLRRGLDQLRSLLARAGRGEVGSGEVAREERRLRREALQNLKGALQGREKTGKDVPELVALVEQALRDGDHPLDIALLKKLRQELESYSAELRDRAGEEEDERAVAHLSPARIPPSYRGRVEAYFRKLSEK